MKFRYIVYSSLAYLLAANCSSASAQTPAALTLANNGKSAYQILRAPDAPESVKIAAQDLQLYIEKSTKAKLPILTQSAAPRAPFISVGDTAAARAAGLSVKGMAWESYRIATRGRNIFILGPDTADGQKTKQGGTSTGTSNGVYTFLEDNFNIRWLMPGPMGEDVPPLAAVAIAALDRTDAPVFQSRRVTHLQSGPTVKDWERRHKLGFSLLSVHNHNWAPVITPDLFETHPEWFAARADGTRIPPTHARYKIETTDPQLVQFFADHIIKEFRADPYLYMFSLSPADGSSDPAAAWSKSPETMALMETDPNGKASHTKLIMKFYNDVAKIVAKEFPDRMVSGYAYSSYIYPPEGGIPPLEPNISITIATSLSYGYKGYRPAVLPEWDMLMKAWSSQTKNITYYDLFNWLLFNGGAITPPAPDIMNFVFPRLEKYGIKGTNIYGTEEWAQAGATNYTLAKMTWNPKLDARQLTNEFYRRAYGEAAGSHIKQLIEFVDEEVKKYYIKDNRASFKATPTFMKEVLGNNYAQIEAMYLAAEKASAGATIEQKARLNFFRDNLVLMQWRLRGIKALPATMPNSPLYKPNLEAAKMIKTINPGFGVMLGTALLAETDGSYIDPDPIRSARENAPLPLNRKDNRLPDNPAAKNANPPVPAQPTNDGAINTDAF